MIRSREHHKDLSSFYHLSQIPLIFDLMILSQLLSGTAYLALLVGICLVLITSFTVMLAIVTHFRAVKWPKDLKTALFCGRVSHARFVPVKHSFAYPLFFCLLDLAEEEILFRGKRPMLWPLSLLMNFHHKDHLKNGEGLKEGNGEENQSLSDRISRLVFERTGGKCIISSGELILRKGRVHVKASSNNDY